VFQSPGVSKTDIIVNGRSVRVAADGGTPLLSVLRDELGLRGSKFGCGTEQCGACAVLIDGEPAYHHHRRSQRGRHALAAAAGVPRRAGRTMRLLPVRHPDRIHRPAPQKSEAEPRRHRRRARCAPLPLRHPQSRREGDPEGERRRMIRKSGHRFSEQVMRQGDAR
jgi:ferredoxin